MTTELTVEELIEQIRHADNSQQKVRLRYQLLNMLYRLTKMEIKNHGR